MKNTEEYNKIGIENAKKLIEIITGEDKQKNEVAIKFLKEEAVDLNYKGEIENFRGQKVNQPIFHFACNNDMSLDFFKTLIETGVNLNIKDTEYGYNSLMQARSSRRPDIVQLLVDTGKINLNDTDKEGKTVFSQACSSWSTAYAGETSKQTVKILLKAKDLQIDCKDKDGITPLHAACKYGYLDLVTLLIENGADLMIKDNNGSTPFMLAAGNSYGTWGKNVFKVLNFLLDSEKDVGIDTIDNKGKTAFQHVLSNNKQDDQKLIEHFIKKSDLTIKNSLGHTPFLQAIKNGNKVAIESFLLHAEIDENEMITTFFKYLHKTEIVKCFLKNGLSIEVKDENGDTILKRCLDLENRKTILEILIENKVDLNEETNKKLIESWIEGYTKARSKLKDHKVQKLVEEYIEVIKLLISNGMKLEKTDVIKKIIFDVVEKCSSKTFETLSGLKHLFDVNKDTNEKGETMLHCACEKGNLINILIEKFDADPTIKTLDGEETVLLKFIYSNSKNGNASSISNDVDTLFKTEKIKSIVNTPNSSGETPLHWACEKGNLIMVRKLIEQGANPNQLDNNKCSPLMFAINAAPVLKRFVEIKKVIELLLEQPGVKENINNLAMNDKSAIDFACDRGDKEIIKLLIENGVDVNLKDNSGLTLFLKYISSRSKNIDIELVQLLFNKDYDINQTNTQGETALHLACRKGNKEVVEFLLNNGADIKCVNKKDNITALHFAIMSENKELIELIINKNENLDINHLDTNQRNFLHYACGTVDEKIIKLFLDKKVDVNKVDSFGAKPFDMYIKCSVSKKKNITDIAKEIFPKDFDVNALKNGSNLFHSACFKGDIKLIKWLLEYKVDVNIKNSNDSLPIIFLIANGCTEGIKLILNKDNTSLNYINKNGISPLHFACNKAENKDGLNIIKLLIENGADINLKDKEGKLAIERAPKSLTEQIKHIFGTTIVTKFDHDDLLNSTEDNHQIESKIVGENDNEDNF